MASRGSNMKFRSQDKSVSQLLETISLVSARREHSRKPDEVLSIVERVFLSSARKIELFARRTRAQWDAWGLEVPGFYKKCISEQTQQ